jgi:hypothetical protein
MRFDLRSGDDQDVRVVLDPLARSVSVQVGRFGEPVLSMEREGATGVALRRDPRGIEVQFRTDDTLGKLAVTLEPALVVVESSLVG